MTRTNLMTFGRLALIGLVAATITMACEPPNEDADDGGSEDSCQLGEQQAELCACGEELVRTCDGDGNWRQTSPSCDELCAAAEECDDGDSVERDCGECGSQTRTCAAGTWQAWSSCDDDCVAQTCNDGEQQDEACGACGTRTRACTAGAWTDWGDCLGDDDCATECEPRDTQEQPCDDSCSARSRVCGPDGRWADWGSCVVDTALPGCQAECAVGDNQESACGNCGTRYRVCTTDGWSSWSQCDDTCTGCLDGQSRTEPCGACGAATATCSGGQWSELGACEEPAECPNTCSTITTLYEGTNLEEAFVGLGVAGDGRLATSSKGQYGDLAWVRVIDEETGEVIEEHAHGDIWNPIQIPTLSSPVWDGDALYYTLSSWQAQFGDDGPELYLHRVPDATGANGWTSHVWRYDEYSYPQHNVSKPALAGDDVVVNSGGSVGGGAIIEQMRGFASTDGAMTWSVDNPFGSSPTVSADGQDIFMHGSGLVLSYTIGDEGARAVYFPDNGNSLGITRSWEPALDADDNTLYAATSVRSFDFDPHRDYIIAAAAEPATGEELPDAHWVRFLQDDERINHPPVLSAELVIVPLSTGIVALDKGTGSPVWRLVTEGAVVGATVGDDDLVRFLEWREGSVHLGTVDLAGRPIESCALLHDLSELESLLWDTGNYLNAQVAPVIRDGHIYVALGSRIIRADVPAQGLADGGWPRLFGDNANTGQAH